MTIDTREMIDYLNSQIDLFHSEKYTEFNDGIVAGLDLARTYLTLREEKDMAKMAKELDK